jgi:peroxiredoxin Q/BCP
MTVDSGPQQAISSDPPTAHPRSLATRMFLTVLACVAVVYGVVLAYHANTPMPAAGTGEASWLEQCRQFCAEYGLVSTGNLKQDAEEYLEVIAGGELAAPLQDLLSDPDFEPAATEEHPLIGQSAPDFTLVNTEDESVSLASFNREGPVVLVFYYGYSCSHCVAQLFALQKDLEYFHQLGAEIVAVSADSPEHTRERYAEYGSFTFPVLSDPEYAVSEEWGVYVRPTDEQQEDLLHGTFVIDRDGTVIFANCGYQPFLDNQSLLHWLADQNSETSRTADASSGLPDEAPR